MEDFAKCVTRPADENRGVANSYLAAQVLGEFLRYYIPAQGKRGVDADRFLSSIHSGGINWVLFGQPDREQEPPIELTDVALCTPIKDQCQF